MVARSEWLNSSVFTVILPRILCCLEICIDWLAADWLQHTYMQTLDNAHNSQAQGLNVRRGRSIGGKRTVDINDEQTDGFLNEIWISWNCWEIGWVAVTSSKQMVRCSRKHVLASYRRPKAWNSYAGYQCPVEISDECKRTSISRARFKCVGALGRIIIRGPYPPSNATIYMHIWIRRMNL